MKVNMVNDKKGLIMTDNKLNPMAGKVPNVGGMTSSGVYRPSSNQGVPNRATLPEKMDIEESMPMNRQASGGHLRKSPNNYIS